MSESAAQIAVNKIKNHFSTLPLSTTSFHGEETLHVPVESLHEVLLWARDHAQFNLLLDLTAIDNLGSTQRFDLTYVLTQAEIGTNIIVRCSLPGTTAPSVTDIWKTADWHERETYDLMGITFENHPDLRRLLMWEGYPYHPLRKDFPIAGLPTELPEVAETDVAPWEGGPFISTPSPYCAGREPHPKQTDC